MNLRPLPETREALSDEEGRQLLEYVRAATCAAVRGTETPAFAPVSGPLTRAGGVFVTLRKHGRLRGCIGVTASDRPLPETARHVAAAAALEDPRFPPVTPEELPELSWEITLLEPPHPITPADVVVGRDGLAIRWGGHHGVLLPQVAVEERWSREEFLSAVCRKAGLAPDFWRTGQPELHAFSATVISEPSPRAERTQTEGPQAEEVQP